VNRDRDPYPECGAAIRQAIARAIEAKCSRAQLAVLAAVIALTGSYSKLVDRVGHGQVADLAEVHPKTVAAALRTLRRCRSIVYRPGSGQGNVSLVGLRKDRTRRGVPERSPSRRVPGRSPSGAKGESIRARRGVSRGSTPEKTSEETTPYPPPRTEGGDDSHEELSRFTGCRATRGTHGAGWKRDPLGTDKPPRDWPHDRPTEAQVLAALAERGKVDP
jgi:hypothetical protein